MVGEISIKIIHGSTPSPVRMPFAGQNVLPQESQILKKIFSSTPTHMGKYQNCKIHGLWVRAQAVGWGQYYQLVKMY